MIHLEKSEVAWKFSQHLVKLAMQAVGVSIQYGYTRYLQLRSQLIGSCGEDEKMNRDKYRVNKLRSVMQVCAFQAHPQYSNSYGYQYPRCLFHNPYMLFIFEKLTHTYIMCICVQQRHQMTTHMHSTFKVCAMLNVIRSSPTLCLILFQSSGWKTQAFTQQTGRSQQMGSGSQTI